MGAIGLSFIPGETLRLEVDLDEAPGMTLYARATVTDQTGAAIPGSPVSMGSVSSTKFVGSILSPDREQITAYYEIFEDAIFTIPSSFKASKTTWKKQDLGTLSQDIQDVLNSIQAGQEFAVAAVSDDEAQAQVVDEESTAGELADEDGSIIEISDDETALSEFSDDDNLEVLGDDL